MTLSQIIAEFNSNPTVVMAFDKAEKRVGNFAFKFGKTSQYWSKQNWLTVAREIKKELK